MTVDGGLVAPGRRPGQRVGRPQGTHVGEAPLGEGEEGVQRHAQRAGHAFDLAQQCNHVVRCQHGGRVVGRPVVIAHGEGPSPQCLDQLAHERIARHGKPGAIAQQVGTPVGIGKGQQRMTGSPSHVWRQHLEPQSP